MRDARFKTDDPVSDTPPRSDVDSICVSIFLLADDLFDMGRFEEFDRILPDLAVEHLDTQVLLAWLTAAMWPTLRTGHEKLPSRAAFIERCRTEFDRRHPERTQRLMVGLCRGMP